MSEASIAAGDLVTIGESKRVMQVEEIQQSPTGPRAWCSWTAPDGEQRRAWFQVADLARAEK